MLITCYGCDALRSLKIRFWNHSDRAPAKRAGHGTKCLREPARVEREK